jgi:hypothetical protein
MPIIIQNCKFEWFPTNKDLRSTYMATVAIAIGENLTHIVADAVNELDKERGLPGIRPEHVFVNFGLIHARAINASDMQIYIQIGSGNASTRGTQAIRRRAMRDMVFTGLGELRTNMGTPEPWPMYDIEVALTDLAGYTVTPDGNIAACWGDARIEE